MKRQEGVESKELGGWVFSSPVLEREVKRAEDVAGIDDMIGFLRQGHCMRVRIVSGRFGEEGNGMEKSSQMEDK